MGNTSAWCDAIEYRSQACIEEVGACERCGQAQRQQCVSSEVREYSNNEVLPRTGEQLLAAREERKRFKAGHRPYLIRAAACACTGTGQTSRRNRSGRRFVARGDKVGAHKPVGSGPQDDRSVWIYRNA